MIDLITTFYSLILFTLLLIVLMHQIDRVCTIYKQLTFRHSNSQGALEVLSKLYLNYIFEN